MKRGLAGRLLLAEAQQILFLPATTSHMTCLKLPDTVTTPAPALTCVRRTGKKRLPPPPNSCITSMSRYRARSWK